MNRGRRTLIGVMAGGLLLLLSVYHLSDYPTTWFDEGSHLHVPKALLQFGAYADYSSDGLRYFGPTLGVGPTVLLPIAAVFKLFGVGLIQARLVIVCYLLCAVYLFYRLGRALGGSAVGALGVLLLATSRSTALFENGRQVLGEVPALCFLCAGFLVWFSAWEGRRPALAFAGLLFGAAAITKYQILLAIAPALAVSFLANLVYYRAAPARVFVWPALVTGGVFALWQAILIGYLGPQTSLQNFAALRAATAGAATVFSLPLMKQSLGELVAFKTFGGLLLVALLYTLVMSRSKSRQAQQWNVLLLFTSANLAWYVFASIGWRRYAFAGLAIGSLLVARFFVELLRALGEAASVRAGAETTAPVRLHDGLIAVVAAWVIVIVLPSLAVTAWPIVHPPANTPAAMAAYLAQELPADALIETWEPELGFLTAHNYHYPPTGTLNLAVRHVWSGGPAPRLQYHPLEEQRPPYVVVGAFARWVDVYPADVLAREYRRVAAIGAYELYERRHEGSGSVGFP
jgi:4-amino-4-deoxy-L-arabinose transferase-like glycosyltransferase